MCGGQLYVLFFSVLLYFGLLLFSKREQMIKVDDLGLLLGTMDPNMLTDGTPVDRAVLEDWNSIFKSVPNTDLKLIECIDEFLDYYEKNEGFDFPLSRKVLKQDAVLKYVKTAKEKAREMCELHNY